MGNFIASCLPHSTVVPSEEVVYAASSMDGSGGGGVSTLGSLGSRGGAAASGEGLAVGSQPEFKSECEAAQQQEPPTSIMKVLLNALYAMEFHKHLAMTNHSENYEFFQAVSHFSHDTSTNKRIASAEANKIYSLYISDAAPLKVDLGEDIPVEIKKIIDSGKVTKTAFNEAQLRVVSLMEKESLQEFLASNLYSELRRRIAAGEMETLIQEDVDTIREIMSKELIEFLGDPDMKKVLSSQTGVDLFRKYLVIEFAEEGLDLWKAVHDMLAFHRLREEGQAQAQGQGQGGRKKEKTTSINNKVDGEGDSDITAGGMEGAATADAIAAAAKGAEGNEGGGDERRGGEPAEAAATITVAPTTAEAIAATATVAATAAKETTAEVATAAAAEASATASRIYSEMETREGQGGQGREEGGEVDIRKTGRELYDRFIKSGCGMECNLSGSVVRKVSRALDDPESTPESIRKAFELVELEIFKLLAYDPFVRFKRSGLYTKYCMKMRLKTQRSSLSRVASDMGLHGANSGGA